MGAQVRTDKVREALLAKMEANDAIAKARRPPPSVVNRNPEVSQGIWVSIIFITALIFSAGVATGAGYGSVVNKAEN